jgi:hypothetical protein
VERHSNHGEDGYSEIFMLSSTRLMLHSRAIDIDEIGLRITKSSPSHHCSMYDKRREKSETGEGKGRHEHHAAPIADF